MKTPEEIASAHAKVTWQQVNEIVKALDKACPDKALWNIVRDGKASQPSECLRLVLASAYDWFRYGN